MISDVLTRETCKDCQFCCVFVRDSLWELPVFPKETYERIMAEDKTKADDLEMVRVDDDGFHARMKLEDKYETDYPDETVPCLFLDENSGCTLKDEDKPLECKIWPLRVMDRDGKLVVAFETICPGLGEEPSAELKKIVEEKIGEDIREYALKHPFIAKPYDERFPVLLELE